MFCHFWLHFSTFSQFLSHFKHDFREIKTVVIFEGFKPFHMFLCLMTLRLMRGVLIKIVFRLQIAVGSTQCTEVVIEVAGETL